MSIAENIARIRGEIAKAAGGRTVTLVAATKMNDASRVREAIAAGIDACGENKVQELVEKDAQGAYAGAPLHFIGHLQHNKVSKVVGKCSLIQSVDSPELLDLIQKQAEKLGITQDILIEINVGGEEQKSGIAPSGLAGLLAHAAACPHVRVLGLMCVPPAEADEAALREYFALMHQLFVDNGKEKYDNVSMKILSMGMTADYVLAVSCGATMVRVGSGIFGARDYSHGK